MKNRILREAEVCALTGLSRTTIWRLEQEGKFPPRCKIAKHATGWFLSQVEEWFEQKIQTQVDSQKDKGESHD